MSRKFSLITLTQGNAVALKRTIDSLVDIIDDVVIGDLSVFKDDKESIKSMKVDCNVTIVDLPFDFLFKKGFSVGLNTLATYTKNDLCCYLNVGEVLISDKNELKNRISPSYNCYYIDHPTETHHWYRVFNKKEIQWGGLIHEEIYGNTKACSVPLFRFDDTPKDSDDELKAWVYNEIKEMIYWSLLLKLIDQPHLIGNTNHGWIQFAQDSYHSFIERLHQKGDMYEAMIRGDYELLMRAIEEKKNA